MYLDLPLAQQLHFPLSIDSWLDNYLDFIKSVFIFYLWELFLMGLKEFPNLLFQLVDLGILVLLFPNALGQFLVLLDHTLFNNCDCFTEMLQLQFLWLGCKR